jgi:Integrase zinc binding domain/Integrase core domain
LYKGIDNKVADALSRIEGQSCPLNSSHGSLYVFSEIIPQWMQDIFQSYSNDTWISSLFSTLQLNPTSKPHLTLHQDLLWWKGKVCVGSHGNWRQKMLQLTHDSSSGGHSGIVVTYHRLRQSFYWPKMKDDVIKFIQTCPNCQMDKNEHIHTPGLLQPLPIPEEAWCSVGIDFITGLPKHASKDVIMVVVDRLTKYAHFIALSHPYTAVTVAQAFFNNVYQFHGLPTSIVFDRDPVFTCRFWKELMHLLGITLNMSTAYHPQTDGQIESVNQFVEHYLRSMLLAQPKACTKWLPLAQYWYNSNFHSSPQTTPFQALYGYPPPSLSLDHPPRSQIDTVDTLLRDRHTALTQLKSNLFRAQ